MNDKELLFRAWEIAMWHVGDSDECGIAAQRVIQEIERRFPREELEQWLNGCTDQTNDGNATT